MGGKGGYTIRQAELRDAERIYALIRLNDDQLVPRSLGNIVESIDRFFVAEADGEMAGCASYQIHPEIGSPPASRRSIRARPSSSLSRRSSSAPSDSSRCRRRR